MESVAIKMDDLSCATNTLSIQDIKSFKTLATLPPLNHKLTEYYKSIKNDTQKRVLWGYSLVKIWEYEKRDIKEYPTKTILAWNLAGSSVIDNEENENFKDVAAYLFLGFMTDFLFSIEKWYEKNHDLFENNKIQFSNLNTQTTFLMELFYCYIDLDLDLRQWMRENQNYKVLFNTYFKQRSNTRLSSINSYLSESLERKETNIRVLLQYINKIEPDITLIQMLFSKKLGPGERIDIETAEKIGKVFERYANDKNKSLHYVMNEAADDLNLEYEAINKFIKSYIKELPERPKNWRLLTTRDFREMWIIRNQLSRKIKGLKKK